jgi:hypothetical protein
LDEPITIAIIHRQRIRWLQLRLSSYDNGKAYKHTYANVCIFIHYPLSVAPHSLPAEATAWSR